MASVEFRDGHNDLLDVLENSDWSPTLTLRPHHAIFTQRINNAIAGKKDTNEALSFMIGLIIQRLDSEYFKDSVGTSISDIQRNRRSETVLLDSLRRLPDETIVHLDLKPDDFCKACPIGRHCTATNVKGLFGFSTDVARHEERCISEIHSALVENGYKEGKDFVFRDTENVLYDFGRKTLNKERNPKPQITTFNSMLVKMGALKGIIQLVNKPL